MGPILTAAHHPDCYPSDPEACLAFFHSALEHASDRPFTPGSRQRLRGIVTPHIDFRVSLAAYAAAFRPLLEEPLAETYLILGVGHQSPLEWNLDRRDYLTPLGRAIAAQKEIDVLAEEIDPRRLFSPAAHEGEHSIEFALLWLQALHRFHPDRSHSTTPVRFIPLLCGGLHPYVEGEVEWEDLTEFHQLVRNLEMLLRKDPAGKKIRLIVSIDGCHLGPRFDHPFQVASPLLKATAGWEEKLWSQVARGKVRPFLEWFREEGNDRFFDGVGALALLLAAGAGKFTVQRTHYEQWFTERDASAVTFSSGRILER